MRQSVTGSIDEDKAAFVHSVFSAIAHRYDLLNTLLSFNQDKYWRRFATGQTGLSAGGEALDVCCGTGMFALEQAKMVGNNGHITGLDFCENMLAKAGQNISKTPYNQNIKLIQGNAMELPFDDDSFDSATIGFALRNVPDIAQVLKEMRRVVKPGGRVVSLELAKPGMPIFKQLYYLYFEQLLPLLGRLGIGQDGPYSYLPESLRRYPHQKDICNMFSSAGLRDAHYYELTGGIVAVHVGTK